MRTTLYGLSYLSLLVASGCYFFTGDEDCLFGGGAAEPFPMPDVRNPYTGQCESSSGGGTSCDDPCAPCPAAAALDREAPGSFGLCESHCTGLDEDSCLDAGGCRGIYTDGEAGPFYLECWSTDMTGPVQGGGCEGLDALECSRHDDCAAVHEASCSASFEAPGRPDPAGCQVGAFARCLDEPGGEDGGLCYGEVSCPELAPECPDGSLPGIADGCFTGACIPEEECEAPAACSEVAAEATCVARADCTPLYEGIDCACDDEGCTCSEWVYDRCE